MRCFKPPIKRFKAKKCKTYLKLATARIRLLRNKKENELKTLKREVAQRLQSGQVPLARIKVELVFREESTIEAYGMIESFCEKVVSCLPVIESQKNCPADLQEAISSIVFASSECADLVELVEVRNQFEAKYGEEFIDVSTRRRAGSQVHFLVMKKLFSKTPDCETKAKILAAIAKEHNVEWDPTSVEEVSDPLDKKLVGPTEFLSDVMISTEFPSIPGHDPVEGLQDLNFSMGDSSIGASKNMAFSETKSTESGPVTATTPDTIKAKDSIGPRASEVTRAPNRDILEAKRSSESVIRSAPNPDTSKAEHSLEDEPRVAEKRAGRRLADLEALEKLSFNDATEAAKEAAKCAEKAAIAAWAAVRLSNIGRMSGSKELNESVSSNRSPETLESHFTKINEPSIEGLGKKIVDRQKNLNHAQITSQIDELESERQPTQRRGIDHRSLKSGSDESDSSQLSVSCYDANSIPDTMQRKKKQSLKSASCDNGRQPTQTSRHNHHQNLKSNYDISGSYGSYVTSDDDESTVAGTPKTRKSPTYIPSARSTSSRKQHKRENGKGSVRQKGSINVRSSLRNITESNSTSAKPEPHHDLSQYQSFEYSVCIKEADPREESVKPVSADVDPAVYDESGSEGKSEDDILVLNDEQASILDSHRYVESRKESLVNDSYGIPLSSKRNVKEKVPSLSCTPSSETLDNSNFSTGSSEEEMDERMHPKASSPLLPTSRSGHVGSSRKLRHEADQFNKKKQPTISYDSYDSYIGKIEKRSRDPHWGFMNLSDMESSVMQESFAKSQVEIIQGWKSNYSSETFSDQVNDMDQSKAPTSFTYSGGSGCSVDSGSESQVAVKFDSIKYLRSGRNIHPRYTKGLSCVDRSTVIEDEPESFSPCKFSSNILEEDQERLHRHKNSSAAEFAKGETKNLSLSNSSPYSDTDEDIIPLDRNIKITEEKASESSLRSARSGTLRWKSK